MEAGFEKGGPDGVAAATRYSYAGGGYLIAIHVINMMTVDGCYLTRPHTSTLTRKTSLVSHHRLRGRLFASAAYGPPAIRLRPPNRATPDFSIE